MKIMNKAAATILSMGVFGAAAFASDEAQATIYCVPGSCNNFGYIYESATGGTSCSTGCSEPQYNSSIGYTSYFGGWYVSYQTNSYTGTPYSGFPNGFGFSYIFGIYCPRTGYSNVSSNGTIYGTTGLQYAFCPGFATGGNGVAEVTAIAP
jgi:hypothetical protein